MISFSTIKGNNKNQNIRISFFQSDIMSALMGVAIGDALGVPVEFKSRNELKNNPVTDMIGYGTYNQPPGTWSDDSSLSFCLAEALTKDFDLNVIANNIARWYNENYWTAHDNIFDIGIVTLNSIYKINKGLKPELAGGLEENDNGNGSLMRILPLVFYVYDKPINQRYSIIKDVSSITHGHVRSVISCFYYIEFARLILERKNVFDIYEELKITVPKYLNSIGIDKNEIEKFDRLLKHDIYNYSEDEINSSGYVLDTLEASIWCLLTSNTYKSAVLKAVNLGKDTDTTAAVTGGLAALVYGYKSIPEEWIKLIARRSDIEDLANRMYSFILAN